MTGGSAREEAPARTPSAPPPWPPPPRPTVSVSLPAWPLPTGRPAGRCPRQRGRPERPGLLQAVEGDWLTPPPGPAVGLTPDLSCPPWPPGLPPAVTHLTQTHAHRKEAWLTRAGGGPEGLGGLVPCCQTVRGQRGERLGQRRPGGPGQPCCPQGRGSVASAFPWSGSWTSEGEGQRGPPSSPSMRRSGPGGGALQPGGEWRHQVSGASLQTLLLRATHPLTHGGWAALEPWRL